MNERNRASSVIETDSTGIFLYGRGVFTTLAVLARQPQLWDKHWLRVTRDAAVVGIDLTGFSERSVYESLISAVAESSFAAGRARLTFSDRSAVDLWPGGGTGAAELSILTAQRGAPKPVFSLGISPYRINTTSPLAGVKSCNYLEHLMALEEARSRGFDEAIRLNERGEVTSACLANIFWRKGGRLFTPTLRTGCLAGTTREFILENLDCEEAMAEIDALVGADEIFLTSAGIGVVQAAEFDGRHLLRERDPILDVLPFG